VVGAVEDLDRGVMGGAQKRDGAQAPHLVEDLEGDRALQDRTRTGCPPRWVT